MSILIIEISKYIIAVLMIAYAYECFSVFGVALEKKHGVMTRQTIIMFVIHFLAYLCLYLGSGEQKMLILYGAEVVFFIATITLYMKIYPNVSRLVVNNMCMLLCIGLIILARLKYDKAIKQFIFAVLSVCIGLVVPVIIRKVGKLQEWKKLYGIVGIISLAAVIVVGRVSGGAKLGFTLGPVSIQPSEFVKILFVFFVAASFYESTEFKNVVKTTIVAALHVLILVASKDLGAALIIFVVYLTMIYVATKQPLYVFAGLGAGAIGAVGAYKLFSHIRVRVQIWQDPFSNYDMGYQVAQSLFAIGTGGWFGMGLFQGAPDSIPVAEEDAIFSAISEEMGIIFALCMILVCLSCYVMFLNIAMKLRNPFYKMVALGLGTCYIFQIFLNIGGITKFIPLTGVTLSLVSYGGSSVMSTMIMFGIIQGLYILREDEEEDLERKRRQQLRAKRKEEKRQTNARRPQQYKIKSDDSWKEDFFNKNPEEGSIYGWDESQYYKAKLEEERGGSQSTRKTTNGQRTPQRRKTQSQSKTRRK